MRRRNPEDVRRYNQAYSEKNREALRERARQYYRDRVKPNRATPPKDRETTLYRMFSADGELVYVGITYNFRDRLAQHRRLSRWFSEVDHWEIEAYATRRLAKDAETAIIRAESPRFNRHERPRD